MPITSDPLFQTVFDQLPEPRLILNIDAPNFTIAAVNKAYETATSSVRTRLIGESIWNIFTENSTKNTASVFKIGLQKAVDQLTDVRLPLFRYDMPSANGADLQRWWQVEIVPVMDLSKSLQYLMCTTKNISIEPGKNHLQQEILNAEANFSFEQNTLLRAFEELKESLQRSEQNNSLITTSPVDTQDKLDGINRSSPTRLRENARESNDSEYRINRIIMNIPAGLAILKGKELIIDIANLPALKLWGKSLQQVIGKRLTDVYADFKSQLLPELLQTIFDTGKPLVISEVESTVRLPDGTENIVYTDFTCTPLTSRDGEVEAILVNIKEITPLVLAKSILKNQQEELHAQNAALISMNEKINSLNEELSFLNEQLNSSNEELSATHQELNTLNEQLFDYNDKVNNLNEELIKSEHRFRTMVMDAPVAMMILQGEELIIDIVNPAMLEIIHKDKTIEGKPLFEVMPEIKGQPATDLFHTVLRTGEVEYGNEVPVMLKRHGQVQKGFFNFSYTPLCSGTEVTGLMDVAVDVTSQVNARQELEDIIAEKTALENTLRASEKRLKGILETMAEGVGIVDEEGQLVYANPMAQRILGLEESVIKERTYHDPQWHNLRIDGTDLPAEEHPMAIMMQTGMPLYDQEIAVQPPNSDRIYISVNAAPIMNEAGKVIGGIGTFMDVTRRRKLMIEKDDFISVASHELKTPVTTLKASLQLLVKLGKSVSDEMQGKLLSQATKSLDKLSNLIADLLNSNRINQGQLQLRKTHFNITDMITGCCQHIRTAGNYNITLKGDADVQLFGDAQQLDQVIVNFVNNAIKYAPESKDIIIDIKKQKHYIKVSVIDKGPGIEPEKQKHLFDRYYRTNYGGAHFSGLGLGLYICAEIIKKHEGEIGVDSVFGEGSEFWFTIPDESPLT